MFAVFASALCGSACVALWRAFLAWEQEVKARENAELKLAKAIESGTVKTENLCPNCDQSKMFREEMKVCDRYHGSRVDSIGYRCYRCRGVGTLSFVVDNRKKAS